MHFEIRHRTTTDSSIRLCTIFAGVAGGRICNISLGEEGLGFFAKQKAKPFYLNQCKNSKFTRTTPGREFKKVPKTQMKMAIITQRVRQAASDASDLQFPFLDLKAEFASMREEIFEAVERVLESQQFILGPEVEALEVDVARLVGCRHAIGCASGSDALLLALMA